MNVYAFCGTLLRPKTARTISISPRQAELGLCEKEGAAGGGWECVNVFSLQAQI